MKSYYTIILSFYELLMFRFQRCQPPLLSGWSGLYPKVFEINFSLDFFNKPMYYKYSDMKILKIEPENILFSWKLLSITKIGFPPYTHIKEIINIDLFFADITIEISMNNLSMYKQHSWNFHMDSCISLGTFQFIFSGAMKCNFRCKKIHIIDDLENQLICMVLLHICQKHTHTFHF